MQMRKKARRVSFLHGQQQGNEARAYLIGAVRSFHAAAIASPRFRNGPDDEADDLRKIRTVRIHDILSLCEVGERESVIQNWGRQSEGLKVQCECDDGK
jgi:hypothetical protein